MYKVNEQLNCAIFLNGREIPLSVGNFVQSIHLVAGAGLKLPLLTLRLVDIARTLENLGLQDGSLIRLSLEGLYSSDRTFRVGSWSRVPAGDGFAYVIYCFFDSPKYWAGTSSQALRGSSYDVLAAIADTCSLKFSTKNTKTSDTMLWVPNNAVYAEFAKDIARCGYANETSHMVLAVDTMGVMRYLDINANPPPRIKAGPLPTQGDASFIQTLDFEPMTKAGMNNVIGGYAHTRHVQAGSGDTTISDVEDTLTYKADCQDPLFNQDLRKLIERGGISYSPVDFGNVHDKYERARYQNTRFDLLNSLSAQVLFGYQTPLDIFDNFSYVAPQNLGPITYDGEYTIKTKIMYIAGTSYYEKAVVVKNGLEK